MLLLLDEDAAHQHGHQFAALEDHLRRVVEEAEAGVREAHRAERQKREQIVRLEGDLPHGMDARVADMSLHVAEDRVVSELDQRQEPAVRFESLQRENQLLQVTVHQIQRKHANATKQKLRSSAVRREVEAEHFDRRAGFVFLGLSLVERQQAVTAAVAHLTGSIRLNAARKLFDLSSRRFGRAIESGLVNKRHMTRTTRQLSAERTLSVATADVCYQRAARDDKIVHSKLSDRLTWRAAICSRELNSRRHADDNRFGASSCQRSPSANSGPQTAHTYAHSRSAESAVNAAQEKKVRERETASGEPSVWH